MSLCPRSLAGCIVFFIVLPSIICLNTQFLFHKLIIRIFAKKYRIIMSKKAVIAGASGLIGSKLLTIMLNHAQYDEVLVLVRKELPIEHKKLVQLIIDFDKLDDHVTAITGHAIFCCLGSTQKKTPDLDIY